MPKKPKKLIHPLIDELNRAVNVLNTYIVECEDHSQAEENIQRVFEVANKLTALHVQSGSHTDGFDPACHLCSGAK